MKITLMAFPQVEIFRSKKLRSTQFLAIGINVKWQTGYLGRENPRYHQGEGTDST